MNKREFNAFLKKCKKKGGLDQEKVKAQPLAERLDVVRFLVRNHRPPLVVELLDGFDSETMSWLACCAYMHKSTNTAGYTFLHTAERPPLHIAA